jgi:hypothetical protein
VFLLGLLSPASARSDSDPEKAVRLTNSVASTEIGERIGLLPDTHIFPDEVLSGVKDSQFRSELRLKSGRVYWLRFPLENPTRETDWRLRLPSFIHLELFGDEGVQVNGSYLPYSLRAYAADPLMVALKIQPGGSRTFYVRAQVHPARSPRMRATIYSAAAYGRMSSRKALELAFVLGVLLVMAAYSLILFASLRDPSYLSFSAFLICMSIYLLDQSEFLFPLTGVDLPLILPRIIVPVAAAGFCLRFSCVLLEARSRFPRWNAFWKLYFVVLVTLAFLAIAPGFRLEPTLRLGRMVDIANSWLFGGAVLMAAFAAQAMRRGYAPARYYLQANIAFFVCFLVWLVGPDILDWLDLGAVSRAALKVGVVLQVTLWSIALGGRVRILKAEKEAESRSRILDLHRLTEEKNQELERKVVERTEQLQAANRRLSDSQEKLASLMGSSLERLEDIPRWVGSMAADLQATLGVSALGVYEMRNETLIPIHAIPDSTGPDMGMVLASIRGAFEFDGTVVLPARGLSGELRGVLAVRGLGQTEDEPARRQLLSSFASHLGNVFEMAQLRHKLLVAEMAHEGSLTEYTAKGIELLKLCPLCGACQSATLDRCGVDGTVLEMPFYLPLRLLGRYHFLRRLGEGGMGTVLEALDEQLNRHVAIKFMRPGHFHDAGARMRFEREIHTLVLVDHPGVVKVFDSGEMADGTLYLIMERLQGRDLGQVIRLYGPGNPRQVSRLLRQGAETLEAAHGFRVIHRDIKPQNLFLTPEAGGFQTRILDFGLAKTLSSPAHLTQTGAIVGTPRYMAPEQVLGRDADERTDTFAFASVVYEALLGIPPVRATVLSEIMSDILHAPVLPPSQFVSWLTPEIDAGFAHALSKNPAERPENLGGWAENLARRMESLGSPRDGWPDSAQASDSRSSLSRGDLATTQSAVPSG